MTSCEKFTDLISARLDGMITPEEEQKLEEHLACCPACRELAQQMSALHAAFPELEEIPAPAGFTQGVMAKIREEQPEPKVVPLTKRPRFKTISGLAACLALCLVLYQTGMAGIIGGGRKSDAADPAADVAVLDAVRSVGEEGQVTQRDTLTLKSLPRGSGILLADARWEPDEEGNSVCAVSADGMEQLLELIREKNLPVEEQPDQPLIQGGTYWVKLLQDN